MTAGLRGGGKWWRRAAISSLGVDRVGYVRVPPKPLFRGRETGRNPIKKPVARPECAYCDHNYRSLFIDAIKPPKPGKRVAVYDLDIIVEYDARIRYIAEFKRFKSAYPEFLIPAFEYVGLKKFAKLLRVPCLVIVEIPGTEMWVFEVDRFERDRAFKSMPGRSGQFAVFQKEEGLRYTSIEELGEYLGGLLVEGGDGDE
jgi:hypothetical protein